MNRNEFNRFVAGIDLPGPGDLEGLRELTVLFPWFHSAHLVLLKGLRENSDIRFDSQLKASALSVNDREVLYHYLFLPPDEVFPEPANPVKEEVVAPVQVSPEPANPVKEEVVTPVQVSPEPENLVMEEVAATEETVAVLAEEVVSPVTEDAHDEPDYSRDSVEIPAEDETVTPDEEEILSPTEAGELLTPDVSDEIMASDVAAVTEEGQEISVSDAAAVTEEGQEISVSAAAAVTDEGQEISVSDAAAVTEEGQEISVSDAAAVTEEGQEISVSDAAAVTDEGQEDEFPGPEVSVAEADPNARLRTREDLIAEIEERLKELESYRQVTFKEQNAEVINEKVVDPEPVPEEVSAPEAAAEPATVHVNVSEYIPEPEPEIEEVPAPAPEIIEAPEPEPEIEESPAPEPEIEEFPVPEQEAAPEPEQEPASTELLELLPETVAEEQPPQPERKLSPADLIDRFIMISPNIERMSPKDYQPVRDLSEQDYGEPGKFITETLAKIYINQGYYTRAINIYEKLTLQYPEKSAYFASRIEKIKDLIK